MEVIILNFTKYKENDAIIDGLTDNGPISFFARGILKTKAKFSFLLNPLTICDAEFVEGNYKYPILKSCLLKNVVRKDNEDLEFLICIMFMAKITKELLENDDISNIYSSLYDVCATISKENSIEKCIWYTMIILSSTGNSLNTEKCCNCGGANNLVRFSFSNGGALCKNCSITSNNIDLLDEKQTHLLMDIVHKKSILKDQHANLIELFKRMVGHISDAFGVTVLQNDLLMCL